MPTYLVNAVHSTTGATQSFMVDAPSEAEARAKVERAGYLTAEVSLSIPTDPADPLAALSAEVESKKKEPRPSAAPVVPYAMPAVQPSRNWLARYRRRVGIRSFIFQGIFLGWTMMFLFFMLSFAFSVTADSSQTNPGQKDAQAAALGTGWCCMIGGWSLVAFPVGIAAIATIKADLP